MHVGGLWEQTTNGKIFVLIYTEAYGSKKHQATKTHNDLASLSSNLFNAGPMVIYRYINTVTGVDAIHGPSNADPTHQS